MSESDTKLVLEMIRSLREDIMPRVERKIDEVQADTKRINGSVAKVIVRMDNLEEEKLPERMVASEKREAEHKGVISVYKTIVTLLAVPVILIMLEVGVKYAVLKAV